MTMMRLIAITFFNRLTALIYIFRKNGSNAFVRVSLEKQSLPRLGTLSTRFFFFSQTRDCKTFTLHDLTDFYVERVTAHRIKRNYHSCFLNSWPNSKTKLKLKHLWEQGGPWCFGGPRQLAYSVYREDRLCIYTVFPTALHSICGGNPPPPYIYYANSFSASRRCF